MDEKPVPSGTVPEEEGTLLEAVPVRLLLETDDEPGAVGPLYGVPVNIGKLDVELPYIGVPLELDTPVDAPVLKEAVTGLPLVELNEDPE